MRRLHCVFCIFVVILLAGLPALRTEAFTGTDFQIRAQKYADDLKAQHAAASKANLDDTLKERDDAFGNGDRQKALKMAEGIVGAMLGNATTAKESISQSWLALARAWHEHSSKAEEGLWASFEALHSTPPLSLAEKAAALKLAASILVEQIDAGKADFDYRTATIHKIDGRLLEASYDDARLADERRQDLLPAQVRELAGLRRREEHERAIIVDNLMTKIGALNSVYRDLASTSEAAGVGDSVNEALSTSILNFEGFRADAASDHAMICAQFNLPLRADATQFASVFAAGRANGTPDPLQEPLPNKDATVRGKELCIHGLEHGQSYHVLLKRGLPSKIGAALTEDKDTRTEEDPRGIHVPDRASTVGFRSGAFILPREGGGAIPMMTVNLDQVDLDLVRVSDRTLYRQIALGNIGNFVDYKEYSDLKRHFSDPYWSGIAKTDNVANKSVTTDIPVRRLLEERRRTIPLASDRGTDAAFISDRTRTGPLEGQFRIDKLSQGAPLSPNEEPGLYAFIAKVPHVGYENFLGEKPETEVYERNAASKAREYGRGEGTSANFGRGGENCSDQTTGRQVACLVSMQWFVITDIGLSYYQGPDEFYVIARSLSTGKSIRDAKIEFVAANNRVLAEGTTDSSGVVKFRSAMTRGGEGNRLAAIVAYNGADFSFIDYRRDSFDLSDHGVAGRRTPNTYDVYVYSDRGIYRPEENINATVLIRTVEGSAPEHLPPLTLRLRGSNGSIAVEKRIAPDEWRLGGTNVSLEIPKTTALGAADLVAFLGETEEILGSTTLQIDHFRPDRARITLADAVAWSVSAPKDGMVSIAGSANAQYLYGLPTSEGGLTDAPAANLQAELSVLFSRAASPVPGCYEDFRFDREEDEFTPLLHRISLTNRTDAQGKLPIATDAKVPAGDYPLEAQIALTLFDEAGKVGTQSRTIPIPLKRDWLGVRPDARLIPGKEGVFALRIDTLALSSNNGARSTTVSYRLYRERNAFLWQQETNSWKYQADVERTLTKEGQLRTMGGQDAAKPCLPVNGQVELELPLGRYHLELADDAGHTISRRIDAGWSSTDVRSPTPDRLTLHADAAVEPNQQTPVYSPGATATFSIEAPFDGEVLVAIANDKVRLWDGTQSTADRRATVKIKIDPQWAGQSFYALATVFRRNTDGTPARGPTRAVGALYFSVDVQANRQLALKMEVANELDPSKPFSVKLRAGNISGKGWATVYAVDEGLLSLTNRADPDPFQYFFGQRSLGLSVLDNYGRILLNERSSEDRSGGDRSRRLLLSNYTSDKILARSEGPVEFVDGVAEVRFSEPFDFQGTVRFMAIAWTTERVGATSSQSVMRQSIVSELRMPRTLSPGDHAEVTLRLYNVGIIPGRYRVSLTPRSPLHIDKMDVSDGGKVLAKGENSIELELLDLGARSIRLDISVTPDAAPTMSAVDLKIEGAESSLSSFEPTTRSFNVAVRAVQLPTPEVAFLELKPGESMKLDKEMLTGLTGGRYVDGQLTVRAHLGTDLETTLASYAPNYSDPTVGTLERLVWQGMALLNASPTEERASDVRQVIRQLQGLRTRDGFYTFYRLDNETGLNESEEIADRTNEGLPRIEQSTIWRTAMALDFLFQAQSAGYPIAVEGFQGSLAALKDEFKASLRTALRDSGSEREVETPPTVDEAQTLVMEDIEDPREAEARPPPAAPPATVISREHAPAKEPSEDEPRQPQDATSPGAGGQQDADKANEDLEFAQNENDREIADDAGPELNVCREDHLYSAMLLAQTGNIDRIDLDNVVKVCGATNFRPFGAAILAAALHQFGAQSEARVVLASVDHGWGSTGHGDLTEDPDGRFDAMFLAFLALADAPEGFKDEIANTVLQRQTGARPLSAAAQVWLLRAFSAFDKTNPKTATPLKLTIAGTLPVVQKGNSEMVGEFVRVDQFGGSGVAVQNNGTTPVYVTLLFRGVPKNGEGAASTGFSVTRRILNDHGDDIATGQTIRPNDILYVLVSGQREISDKHIATESDPILIFDGIASNLEIIDKDVFELARESSVGLRAVLPPEGKIGRVRIVEARDDGLMTVVRPDKKGHFQIGYTVRVVAPGTYVLPGTLVEDLRRTEMSTRTPSQTIRASSTQNPQ